MGIEVRDARADDDAALAGIDRLTWTSSGSPAPRVCSIPRWRSGP